MYGRTVFKDESKLSFDFVPDELPHREKQLNRLFILFRSVLTSDMAQNALLVGSVGTGKTAGVLSA
jgi:cell division control protein 6